MKLNNLVFTFLFIVFSTQSMSGVISANGNWIEVGNQDTFIDSHNDNTKMSQDIWMKNHMGVDYNKVWSEDVRLLGEDRNTYVVENETQLAIDLQGSDEDIDYFSISVSSILFPSEFTFLFDNTENEIGMDWAVIDLASFVPFNISEQFMSNVMNVEISGFNIENTEIPEPSALALLGIGLAAMGFKRRRNN